LAAPIGSMQNKSCGRTNPDQTPKTDSDQFDALAASPGLMVRSPRPSTCSYSAASCAASRTMGPPHPLMSHVKPRRRNSPASPQLGRGDRCDDRATVGAKPETSVNKLLFAGSCMSVFPSGAFPVFERASILRSASKDGREFPLPWLRSRRCTRFVFTGPCPGAGSLRNGSNVPLTPLGSPALLGDNTGGGDRAADGPDEARELARDRGDGNGLQFAPSDQRPVTPVQAISRTARGAAATFSCLSWPTRGGC